MTIRGAVVTGLLACAAGVVVAVLLFPPWVFPSEPVRFEPVPPILETALRPPPSAGERKAFGLNVGQCWNVGGLSECAFATTVIASFNMERTGKPDFSSIRTDSFHGGGGRDVRIGASSHNSCLPEIPLVRRLQARFRPRLRVCRPRAWHVAGLTAPAGSGIACSGRESASLGGVGAWAAVPAPGGFRIVRVLRGRCQAARRCRSRAFRRSRRPMRWTFRATTERATTRAKPSAPCARTRSRPRCPRLLIADSTAGC